MNPTTDPVLEDLMARWRRFVAANTTPAPDAPAADLDARYEAALARAEGRWLPPRRGLPDGLAAVTAAWDSSWTAGLRASDTWAAAKPRLADVRRFLAEGNVQDAQLELECLLEAGYPPARDVLVVSQKARTLKDDPTAMAPEQLREGLERLVAWLEGL